MITRVTSLVMSLLVVLTFASPSAVASSTVSGPFIAKCDGVGLRTSATSKGVRRTIVAAGTRVKVVAKVTGRRHRASCGPTRFGHTWYRISAINGQSVASLYGVKYLYGVKRQFKPRTARALGVYVHGAAWDPGLIDAYTKLVGRRPAMALSYHDWAANGDLGELFPLSMIKSMATRGITPILTWEPWDWNNGASQPAYRLSTIVAGTYDTYLRKWATAAKGYGEVVFIRFAHEMNIKTYPWGVGVNGNTPAQYVAAWRHVVDIFRAAGATNVKWIWSPNVEYGNDFPFKAFYPGGSYVDWVGLDGYNWGSTRIGWQSFATVFGGSYAHITALAPNKPVLVSETASTEAGGSKANWILNAFLASIPTRFPKVAGVIWFDQRKETTWQVNSSSASLSAFRNVVADPAWQGHFP